MCGRYGYGRITARLAGSRLGREHEASEARSRRREGLKVPQRQPERGRLWLAHARESVPGPSGPTMSGHETSRRTEHMTGARSGFCAWSMSSPARRWPSAWTGSSLGRSPRSLADLMLERGMPEHIRSDHGPEFVAQGVRGWTTAVGSKPAYVEPGSSWKNGHVESFDSKLRDTPLSREILCPLKEAQVPIKGWRHHCNAIRPHSAPKGPAHNAPRLARHDASPPNPDEPTSDPEPRSRAGHGRCRASSGVSARGGPPSGSWAGPRDAGRRAPP